MQLVYLKMHYNGLTRIYIMEKNVLSFKGVSLIYLFNKEVYPGSTLGPLLFSVFINDLPLICSNSYVQLYADDTMVIYTSKPHLLQI